MKRWLRVNSSLFARYDPPATVAVVCQFCGHRDVYLDPETSGAFEVAGEPKHNIGFVVIGNVRHNKYCDGTEEA